MQRLAVIGLGGIARRHRSNLRLLFPKAEIYSMSASGRVPRNDIEHCDHLVSNMVALLDNKVDMAIVASPAPFHAKYALPLIKAGIPVLIEKPIASCLEDADALLDAVAQTKTTASIGYCLRCMPSARIVKTCLENKSMGHLVNVAIEVGQYLPDWRPDQDYHETVSARADLGGGALLELSHELDYARWLMGELAIETAILSSSRVLGLDVEDCADILAVANQTCVVSIHLDFIQRAAYRRCRFVGSEGTLLWDLLDNSVRLITKEADNYIYRDANWTHNDMYLDMLRAFISSINGEASVLASLQDAKKTLTLIEQIRSKSKFIGSV